MNYHIFNKTYPLLYIVRNFLFIFLFLGTATQVGAEQFWTYSVQPGDNLWNLSKKYLSSMRYWKELQELNNIQDPMKIQPGTPLRFPMKWMKMGASVGTVVELKGEAILNDRITGKAKKVHKGMLLWENDTLRTGASSNATIQFADGSKILILEDSELKVENLLSYGTTGMAETKTHLKSGRIHNKVTPRKGPGSRFEITTPSAIAAVRGTEYRISSEENGESKAEVVEGEVGVDSSGVSKIVPGGFGTISYTDREPLDPVKLLDPPDLHTLPRTVRRVPFQLKIKPIQGAIQYRMQIAESDEFDALVFNETFPSEKIWGPDLPDRNYFLRIHGIDENGLEGMDNVHQFVMDAHPVPPIQIQPQPEAVIHGSTPIFSWSRPQDATSYRLQLSQDEQFTKLLLDERDFQKLIMTPSIEIPSGVYFWRVASINQAGKTGPFSDNLQFRKAPDSPDISASKLDVDDMMFRWRKAESGQKYKCQISSETEFKEIIADEEVVTPQYSFNNFQSGSYYIRIAIIDTDGYVGPFSTYQTVEIPAPPAPFWAYFIPVLLGLVIVL